MPSSTEKWLQIEKDPAAAASSSDQTSETPTSPPKTGNSDIDNSVLKSFIKSEIKKSPVIDFSTQGSSRSKEAQDEIDSANTAFHSVANQSQNDTAELSNEADCIDSVEQYGDCNTWLEDMPMDLLFDSSNNLGLMLDKVSSNGMSYGSEFQNKWPVPETAEEIRRMFEKEQAEGDLNSQLALCLHLMENAWKVDSKNTSEEIKPSGSSSMIDDFRSGLSLSSSFSQATSRVNEAMITESRNMLKQLAHTSQTGSKGVEAEAQYLLGNCYGMGAFGWPINHKRAFQWYFHASKNGHAEATYRVAVCYELGLGTEKDVSRAIVFYRKAAHLMHVPSMYKLGIILMRGYCDHPVSKREAVVWLQRAACTAIAPLAPGEESKTTTIGGHGGIALPHALHALAVIHLTGECENTSIVPDPKYAIKLLHNAARLGYAPSQYKLGECYESGIHCPEDESQSIYWYSLAAQQDYPEACLAISGWYLTGSLKTDNLTQSDQEAFIWAHRAAKLSRNIQPKTLSARAYYTLGIYYDNGIGVSKSLDTANRWYKKAAQYGHTDAIKKMDVV
ncbi:MAG: hypothetical protein EXX96DRAFT_586258 [Benjaminiella poitrasii]|nr:MAG: hypothetical protein EXX96DRAFT_586258 [Benjaminiella poitrasii]